MARRLTFRYRRLLLPAALLLAACRVTAPADCTTCGPDTSESPIDTAPIDTAPPDTAPPDTAPPDTGPFDADADGYLAADDCDDTDPTVHPGADEGCDVVDNDCDGLNTECTVDGANSLVEHDGSSLWLAATFAGDLDADGRDEVFLDAYTENDFNYTTEIVCGAQVEPGENTSVSAECAVSEYVSQLAPVGDADGDGTSDLAIATVDGTDRIALVRGFDAVSGEVSPDSASAWLIDSEPGSDAYLHGPGADIDGDGLLEFEYWRESHVAVVVSPAGFGSGGTVAEWGWEFDMESGDWAAIFADVDGDGLADVAAVGSGADEPDTILVYSGAGLVLGGRYDRTAADVTISPSPNVELVWPCSAVDVDGDGLEELQGQTTSSDWRADTARFYSGVGASPTTEDSLASMTSSGRFELEGCLTPVGDVDRDGQGDLAVPVSMADDRMAAFISAPALSGATLVDEGPLYAVFGGPFQQVLPVGWSSPPGDIDGDGFHDLLLMNDNTVWFFTDLVH